VYLFGSRARGDGGKQADIDLALLTDVPLAPVARWELQEDLAALAHADVDLVDLLRASTVMRVQVLRDAQLLLDRNPSRRIAFETMALSAYARLNEERRAILDDIVRRGRVYA
jgi:predicted nucleotidyltransferase